VTVATNGTLAGWRIGSNVTARGRHSLTRQFRPGNLTVAGNVILQSGSTKSDGIEQIPVTNDQVAATAATATTITYGGTLSVGEISRAPWLRVTCFKLFVATNTAVRSLLLSQPSRPGAEVGYQRPGGCRRHRRHP